MQESSGKDQTISSTLSVPVGLPSVKLKTSSGIFSVLLDAVLIVVISTLVAAAMLAFGPKYFAALGQAQEQQLTTVDLDLLAREQMTALAQGVRDGDIDAKDMPEKTAVFAQALVEEVQGYGKEGKVVIRSDALVAVPESVRDLTDSIRINLIKTGSMYQLPKHEGKK